jgi:PAT family beta-lactamase induction signal transducer AmpG
MAELPASQASGGAPAARRWGDAVRVYREPAVLRMFFLGFSAGLPLLLVLGTLSFWLREAGVTRTMIGYFSWVGLVYGIKWAWAPLVDRMPLPWLTRTFGRRRGWLLASQATIAAGLIGMALADPQVALWPLLACALVVAFGSATQDIALDAYRIESAAVEKQGALAAAYQTGYRLAMIWAGAGALWIAARAAGGAAGYDAQAWTAAYLAMAATMPSSPCWRHPSRSQRRTKWTPPSTRWRRALRASADLRRASRGLRRGRITPPSARFSTSCAATAGRPRCCWR